MCGIVGFVNYKQDISNYKNILLQMNNTLSRRGPDEEGNFIDKHVALAHKRLIIIDPDGGKQPMRKKGPTPDSHFTIVYNGQIYTLHKIHLLC